MDILGLLKIIFYYPIFNVLMFLYWVVRDFGLSIVLLTVCVRLAMVPMTFRQLRYSRKMQEIQPQINALKAQYKGDNQGLMRAQQELFKANGVSAFGLGGCLPLVVQMPFLYGLFYALQSGLRGNTAGAINDGIYPFLSFTQVTGKISTVIFAPGTGGTHPLDPFLRWFSWLPGHPALNLNLADPTHILPILAALFTFIQIRMSQVQRKTVNQPTPSDSKSAAQQQSMQSAMGAMQYIMPAFTLFIGWQYAAGLALYWTVGTVFTMTQQYIISGWGGLFKGIPRLEAWGKQQDALREARKAEKKARLSGVVVDSLPSPAMKGRGARNGGAGAKSEGITTLLKVCSSRRERLFSLKKDPTFNQAVEELKREGPQGAQALAALIDELLSARCAEIEEALAAASRLSSQPDLVDSVKKVISAPPVIVGQPGRFPPVIIGGGKIGWDDSFATYIKKQASEVLATLGAAPDWIDQDKTAAPGNGKAPARPRTFSTLAKPKEASELNSETSEAVATPNGVKNGNGSGSLEESETSPATMIHTPRSNQPPVRKKQPPRNGTLPKPKGGKR